jgi:hypothetical protein
VNERFLSAWQKIDHRLDTIIPDASLILDILRAIFWIRRDLRVNGIESIPESIHLLGADNPIDRHPGGQVARRCIIETRTKAARG